MKYALGNMLNGAGGLNADQLALDLQFAEDKTLTARKGPTPILTRGSSATFVGSNGLIQSVGNDVARFDHDPVTLVSRGLLIEESRTNNVQRSEEFSDAYWAKSRVTITANATTAPDGATTADKMVETATSLDHNIGRLNISLSPQQTLTYSVFVKSAERSEIQLRLQENVNGIDCLFNLSTLAITPSNFGSGSGSTGSIVAYPNGWYRCAITGRPSGGTGTTVNVANFIAVSGNVNYTGNGTSGIFIWGAQLEAGSFATSYIPTTTSALARSADVCSITAPNFATFYNQPEGTLFADVTPQAVAQVVSVLVVNTTTFNQSHTIFKGDATFNATGRRWGASTNLTGINPQATIATSTDVATTRSRLAYAYKLNDFAFAASGSLVGTDTSGTLPSPTAMHIGMRDAALQINGHLAAVRYYKKRLDNSKLITLTV